MVLIFAHEYGDELFVATMAPGFRMSTGVLERFSEDVIDSARKAGSALIAARMASRTSSRKSHWSTIDYGVIWVKCGMGYQIEYVLLLSRRRR